MKKADEELSHRIIEALREKGLLSEATLEKLLPRLQSGRLNVEDWKLLIELDIGKGEVTESR